MPALPYRVVVVDHHPLFLEAICERIDRTGDLRIVGKASNSEVGLRCVLDTEPDLAVIHVEIPGRGALACVEDLASRVPGTQVVLFGDFISNVLLEQALRLNVAGYVLSSEAPDTVLESFRAACRGENAFSAEISRRMQFDPEAGRFVAKHHSLLLTLTNRQLVVLRHLASGESVKDVAKSMCLSERAIESQKYRIMRRLGIHDRVELARYAIREGLLIP